MRASINKAHRKIYLRYNTNDIALKTAVRNIPGYVSYRGIISVPSLPDIVEELKKLGFTVSGELPSDLQPIDNSWVSYPDTQIVPKNGYSWFEWQKNCLKFIKSRPNQSGMVTADMGSGKTGLSALYVADVDEYPVLYIVPATIKTQTCVAIRDWIGLELIPLYTRTPYPLDKNISYCINPEIVPDWLHELKKCQFKVIIIDEFHKAVANNQKSRTKKGKGFIVKKTYTRSGAIFNLIDSCKSKVLYMSGTPWRSKPSQLYPALHQLDDNTFTNYYDYVRRYCNYSTRWGGKWGGMTILSGAKNEEELAHIMRNWSYRVEKDDIAELPQVHHIPITFDGDITAYKKLEDSVMGDMDISALQSYLNSMGNVDKCMQDMALKNYLDNSKKKILDIQNAVEQLSRSAFAAKKEAVVDWVENFLESGDKIILTVYHRATADYLYNAFKKQAALLNGGLSPNQRDRAKDAFMQDKQVLIAQMSVLTGIDGLQNVCCALAHCEFATYTDMVQAEDRINRIGQTKKVQIFYLLCRNTLDEYQLDSYNTQLKVFDKVFRPDREKRETIEMD